MKRPFQDKSEKPSEQAMQAALGNMYEYYKEILELANAYSSEWVFTKSSGWMLKVFDRSKALLYIIPLFDSLRVSMAIRENERDAFLLDSELEILHETISISKKYQEGFALRFDVSSNNEFEPLEILIRKLIKLRS
jgi:hypothetical protein